MVDPPPLVRPVEGPVASRFSYDRAAPFRRGRRRVVRFSVAGGTPVRAPCAGRVTHAGATPGGPAVTLRCGAWSVTLTGAAPDGIRRGRTVAAGRTVARARTATVGLGVRRASDPFGYVDPLPLLRDPGPAHRFVPLGRAPRTPPVAPEPAPARRVRPPISIPSPATRPEPTGMPAARPGAPLVAWIGLGLAAVGLPAGAVRVRARRRHRARSTERSAVRS